MSPDGDALPSVEPAGLYLHVPFCSAICPYCDFAVLVGRHEKRRRFVETLRREIVLHRGLLADPVDTVYLGGGTPSILEADDLSRLLDAVRETFEPAEGTRFYLEANPEDVTPESLAAWRRLGIGTLSLGTQSFDDGELRFLGRRHDAATAQRSVELAVEAGFDTVSIDLIYGLPGRGESDWRRNLEQAAALRPDHLSCYGLELHPRTPFGKRQTRGELTPLPDDTQADLFQLTHRWLADHGYPAYEVSNFACSPEHRSRHNAKYWHHVPYLGLGPSAHSFDGGTRWWNERSLPRWQRRIEAGRRAEAGREEIDSRDLALETLMLAFRTTGGVDLDRFEARFGFDLVKRNRRQVDRLLADGVVRHEGRRLVPTLDGLAVADGLAAAFTLDGAAGR